MNALENWINPQHLTAEAIADRREQMRSSPVGAAFVDDFLRPAIADAVWNAVRDKIVLRDRFGVYDEGEVGRERWQVVPEERRMYHFQSMSGVVEGCERDRDVLVCLMMRRAIESGALTSYFEQVSGMTLPAVSTPHAHRYGRDHFLRWHNDTNHNRKLAVIIYLSKAFGADQGGCLALRRNGAVRDRIAPRFNRCAFFDVLRNDHCIEPFAGPGEATSFESRYSFGWWYQEGAAQAGAK